MGGEKVPAREVSESVELEQAKMEGIRLLARRNLIL